MELHDRVFPFEHKTFDFSVGLSKREYFAALALQGLLTDKYQRAEPTPTARRAVEMADALLSQLNNPQLPEGTVHVQPNP